MQKHLLVITIIATVLLSGCTAPVTDETPDQNQEATSGNPLVAVLSKKIAQNPRVDSLYFKRAIELHQEQLLPEAIVDMQKAVELSPKNFAYRHYLADLYLDNLESQKAVETLRKALELKPDRIPTLLKLSEFQYIIKEHPASMTTIGEVFQLDGLHPEGFYMRGRNLREMGDTLGAIKSFESAVEQDPDHIESYIELGMLYDNMGNPKAEQFYKNALFVDSTYYDGLFDLAWYYHRRGQLDDAIVYYKKAAVYFPQDPDIQFNTALLYLEKEDFEKGNTHLNICIEVEPTYSKAYFYRGAIAQQQGRTEDARKDYEQALALNPNYTAANEALSNLKK